MAEQVMRYDRLGTFVMAPSTHVDGEDWSAVQTPEGYLRCYGSMTRIGVFQYSDSESEWAELRTEDEVFSCQALESFGLMIITDDHPEVMLTAQNASQYQCGHVGDAVTRDGERVRAQILITDPALIQRVKAGKQELSVGYNTEVLEQSGVSDDGIPYDGIQTKIRGNHLAVVDAGRAGPT